MALYPDNLYVDTAKEIVKMVSPVKKPIDLITDEIIDQISDLIKKKSKGTDTDGDGIPDNKDPDDDNNGIPDEADPNPKKPDEPKPKP